MPEKPTIYSESSLHKEFKNDMEIALTSSAKSRLTKYKSSDFSLNMRSTSILMVLWLAWLTLTPAAPVQTQPSPSSTKILLKFFKKWLYLLE